MQSNNVTQQSAFDQTIVQGTIKKLHHICPGYRYQPYWVNFDYISLILTSTSDSLCLQVLTNYYQDGELLAQMCDRHGWELVADRFGSWEIFIPWHPFPFCAWGGCTVRDILNRMHSPSIYFDHWLSLRKLTGQTQFPRRWSKQWLNHAS